jgi:hypothetical protein
MVQQEHVHAAPSYLAPVGAELDDYLAVVVTEI